jgi:hypothetical protein
VAIRPFTSDDVLVGEGAHGPVNHHQLLVIAANPAEVVRLAGGWLYDRASAGWAVNVVVDDCGDGRPLSILGANRLQTDAETVLRRTPRHASLAVSAAVLRDDTRIRSIVVDMCARGAAQVTVWGEQWPAELGRPIEPACHRLSLAAQAFKSRALTAAAAPTAMAETETLFELRPETVRPLYSV